MACSRSSSDNAGRPDRVAPFALILLVIGLLIVVEDRPVFSREEMCLPAGEGALAGARKVVQRSAGVEYPRRIVRMPEVVFRSATLFLGGITPDIDHEIRTRHVERHPIGSCENAAVRELARHHVEQAQDAVHAVLL